MVRQEMVGHYGSDAYINGLSVYATVSSELQNHAQQAVFNGLTDYDRRHGYRGAEAHIEKRGDWQSTLRNTKHIHQFIPAIVTAVENDGIFVMLTDGTEERVSWQSMRWAAPFLNNSSRGAAPRSPSSVTKVGDLIRVEKNAEGTFLLNNYPKFKHFNFAHPHDGAFRRSLAAYLLSSAITTGPRRHNASLGQVLSPLFTALHWMLAIPPQH